MTAKEIVKRIMDEKDISNADMAAALDISQAALWDRLNSAKTNNMTVKKLNSMLKYLGYEVVVLPRGRAGRLEGSFVVSDSETSKSPYDLAELLKED